MYSTMNRKIEDTVSSATHASPTLVLKTADGESLLRKSPAIALNEIYILSDGRLLWRVFDNLLNNACKYSLAGTRVYITLESVDEKALVVFKNISSAQLNITSEELMERFVRGDSSRNTEGSGLGLSISKSLTELQKGKFQAERQPLLHFLRLFRQFRALARL